jgi:hypothetical protein
MTTVNCYVCGQVFDHVNGPAEATHGVCPACLPGQYAQALQARGDGAAEVTRRLAARFPALAAAEIKKLVGVERHA